MKKSLISLLIVLVALVGFISCSEAEEANASALPKSVTIGLEGIPRQGSKTILPAEVVIPDKYDVTLTPMNLVEGQWLPSENESAKLKYEKKEATPERSLTLENVKLGTYQVSITAYKNDAVIMTGSTDSGNLLNVTASGANSITIALNLISSGDYTGNIEVVFDWSAAYKKNDVLREATDNGTLTFQLLMKQSLSDDSAYEVVDEQSIGEEGKGKTTFTFTSQELPVTQDGMIYFKIYSGEQLLVNNFKVAVAQIYAGHTSRPDQNEANVFIIRNSDIAEGKNVSNVAFTVVDGKPVITWDNVTDRNGNNVLDKVVLTFTKKTAAGEEALEPITVPVDGNTGLYTFEAAEPNTEYGLSVQAFHTSGYASSKDDTDLRIMAETKVTEIHITSGIPEGSITLGSEFTLTVKVLPELALNKTYTWSFEENVFSCNGDTFTATGIGSSVIKVTANGNQEVTDETPEAIKVVLAAPENVSAILENNGISVSWNPSEMATSYDVYRSINGEDYTTEPINVTDTTYADKDIYAGKSYSYKVVAVYDDTAYNSAESDESETVEVKGTVISITRPEIVGQEISFGDIPDVNYVMADDPFFTITVGDIAGATSYKWDVDGIFSNVVGQTFEINSESTYFDTTAKNPRIELTLRVNEIYSKTLTIFLITEKDGAVTIDQQDQRISANTDETGTARTIQLTASVDTQNEELIYYSSSNTNLATVDENGLVTFNPNAFEFGEVTITASSAFGPNTDTVTFDVYKATVNEAEELLIDINTILNGYFNTISASFNHDWWYWENPTTDDPRKYTSEDGTIVCENETGTSGNDNDGYITFNKNFNNNYYITGTLGLNAEYQGLFQGGYLGVDKLETIGYGNNTTLTITLPYNQGDATIKYDNINVLGDTRKGTYTLTFNEINGIDGSIEENHGYTIDDSNTRAPRLYTNP